MTKLKHFAFSFALAGALAFGMGTVTKAAEPASGTTIMAPAAKQIFLKAKIFLLTGRIHLKNISLRER